MSHTRIGPLPHPIDAKQKRSKVFKKDNGIFLAFLSTAAMAAQYPILKIGLQDIAVSQAVFLEAAFTIVFCILFHGTNCLSTIIKSLPIAGAGLLNGLGLIFLFQALIRLDPATVSFLGRAYVLYALILAAVIFQEKYNRQEIGFILVCIIGIFMTARTSSWSSEKDFWGLGFALLYPLCFAGQNAVSKLASATNSSEEILLGSKLVALLPLGIFIAIDQGPGGMAMPLKGSFLIMLATLVSTYLGLQLFYKALAKGSFASINLVKALQPLFVLALSWPFFEVQLDWINIVGMLLTIGSMAGLAMVQARPFKPGHEKKRILMTLSLCTAHKGPLRRAISLSKQAMQHGNEPFGAVLTVDDEILLEAENTIFTDNDATRHAEMNLVSAAARQFDDQILAKAVLYSSTEPCAMCSAAAFLVGIRQVVYACSNEALAAIAGKGLHLSCRDVLTRGSASSLIEGPILEDEALGVHKEYWVSMDPCP